jgi:hypothetical protein
MDRAGAPLREVEYRGEASLLVLGPDEAALDRLSGWAELAGCRVAGRATLSAGGDEFLVPADAVMVESGEHPGSAAGLVARLISRKPPQRVVLAVPRTAVDAWSDLILHPCIEAVCEATPHDWVTAIGHATARSNPRLHDVTKGQGTARLQQLSVEVGRVANILAALSEDETVASAAGAAESEDEDGRKIDSGFVRSIIRARRLRDQFFRGEWFADPAWDMLLDLMAARLDRQRVAVSSLCIAAAVPPTTALRWIKALCEQGLFVRVADPEDGRRVFIELSDDAAGRLEAYLKSAHRLAPLIL